MRDDPFPNLLRGDGVNGPAYDVYGRLRIDDLYLDEVLGFNPLLGATWTANVDQLCASGEIRLGLNTGTNSTSPFMASSQLVANSVEPRVGRRFALETACVPKGATPTDFHLVFDGEIDAVDVSSEQTVLTCRDLMCIAEDTQIEPDLVADQWGFWRDAESMADRIVGIKNAVNSYAPQIDELFVQQIGDPEWTVIASWTDAGQSVADAWHAVVLQRGWAIHYRYLPTLATSGAAVIYDPLRGAAGDPYQLQYSDLIRFRRFGNDRTGVRNAIALIYGDPRVHQTNSDPASIAKYRRRYMLLSEDATSQIDQPDEVNRMIVGAMADLSEPSHLVDYERFYFWPVELADQQILPADNLRTSTSLSLAVIGYTHSLDFRPGGQFRSTIRTIGAPVAARRRWRKTQPRMTHVSLNEPSGAAPTGAVWYQVPSLDPPA